MELETTLRANLDPTNPAGRVVAEYRMTVTQLAGALVVRIYPEGFNAQEQIYTFQDGRCTPATEDVLAGLRIADGLEKEQQVRSRDLFLQAAAEAKREEEAKLLAKQREEELAAAALARPADISKGTVVEP